MNSYKKILAKLQEATAPVKKVVFSFGRSSPPTKGHAINMDEVMDLPADDHFLFFSHSFDNKKNPVQPELKLRVLKTMRPQYASRMFLTDKSMPSVIQIAKFLEGKGYQHLVMAVGEDRVDDFTELLNKYNGKEYNFAKIEVITTGSRDPDVSGTKMREWAMDNDFQSFMHGMDSNVPESLAKELFNHVRENLSSGKSKMREAYVAGDLFKVGDIVLDESNKPYQIIDRGPSFVKVVDTSGHVYRKWLDSITEGDQSLKSKFANQVTKQITFKGLKTKSLPPSAVRAFESILESNDSFAVYAAIKSTDEFFSTKDVVEMHQSFERSGQYLKNLGVLESHQYRQSMEESLAGALLESIPSILKITKKDKTKTAEFLADVVGVNVEGKDPEQIINAAAKKIAKADVPEELMPTFGEMFSLADEVGIEWKKDIFTPEQQKLMGIIDKMDEQYFEHIFNVVCEHVTSFSDVIEAYDSDELVVRGRLLEEFEGDSNTDKAVKAIATSNDKESQVKVKEPSTRKQLLSRAKRVARKFIHDRKLWKTLRIVDDKDRKKLDAIFNGNGSVITISTQKLADKVGAMEAERLLKQMELTNEV